MKRALALTAGLIVAAMPLAAQPSDGLDGARYGLTGDVQHTVDIEQDAGHSGHSHRRALTAVGG